MNAIDNQFDGGVLIVGAPRSGTSLVHFMIKSCGEFWSLPSESSFIWRRYFGPEMNSWESDAIDSLKIDESCVTSIRKEYRKFLSAPEINSVSIISQSNWSFNNFVRRVSLGFNLYLAPFLSRALFKGEHRSFVDKNTSLSGSLLAYDKVFPGIKVIYVIREPRENIRSIYNAWQTSGRFRSYHLPEALDISDYHSKWWKFGLPEGWLSKNFSSTFDVAAYQWLKYHEYFYSELTKPCWRYRTCFFHFEDLLIDRESAFGRISSFLGMNENLLSSKFGNSLPDINRSSNKVSHAGSDVLNLIPSELHQSVDDLYSKIKSVRW